MKHSLDWAKSRLSNQHNWVMSRLGNYQTVLKSILRNHQTAIKRRWVRVGKGWVGSMFEFDCKALKAVPSKV